MRLFTNFVPKLIINPIFKKYFIRPFDSEQLYKQSLSENYLAWFQIYSKLDRESKVKNYINLSFHGSYQRYPLECEN